MRETCLKKYKRNKMLLDVARYYNIARYNVIQALIDQYRLRKSRNNEKNIKKDKKDEKNEKN